MSRDAGTERKAKTVKGRRKMTRKSTRAKTRRRAASTRRSTRPRTRRGRGSIWWKGGRAAQSPY